MQSRAVSPVFPTEEVCARAVAAAAAALDAAEHLSIAIDKLGGAEIAKRSQRHKIYFRYLRSLCYRVLQDFEKS